MINKRIFLLIIWIGAVIWSVMEPYNYLTWILEMTPVVVGVAVLIASYRNFTFTSIVYIWVFIASICITVGAHYTYSRVPLFTWAMEVMGHTRNNYDKLGHVVQGILPYLLFREYFIRKTVVTSNLWLEIFAMAMSITIAVTYELIEWLVALIGGGDANDFLGAQGYWWDAQSDISCAIIGILFAFFFLRRIHNKQIKQLLY